MATEKQVTASEAMLMASRVVQEDAIFAQYVAEFLRRYGPEDRDEFCEFSAALVNLMRRMYLDAETPARKTVDAMMETIGKSNLSFLRP